MNGGGQTATMNGEPAGAIAHGSRPNTKKSTCLKWVCRRGLQENAQDSRGRPTDGDRSTLLNRRARRLPDVGPETVVHRSRAARQIRKMPVAQRQLPVGVLGGRARQRE